MIIDGKQISEEIKAGLAEKIAKLGFLPMLDIVYVGNDPVIENFIKMKIRFGTDIGVETIVHRFPESIAENILLDEVKLIAKLQNSDGMNRGGISSTGINHSGMIIQLPLPSEIDVQKILNAVPAKKDADVLSDASLALYEKGLSGNISPVAGAFMEILERNNISVKGKKVVILGRGRLVGKPSIVCMKKEGAIVTELNRTTGDHVPYLLTADIVATGIGRPHFIKPEMIKEGAIILDGGTSELNGKIVGDADPACALKCQIFTPVPKGIGPITVAILFRNLINLCGKK